MDLKEIFNNSTTQNNNKNIDKNTDDIDWTEYYDAKRLYDAWHPKFDSKKDKCLYWLLVLVFCSPFLLWMKIGEIGDKIGKWVHKIDPEREIEL